MQKHSAIAALVLVPWIAGCSHEPTAAGKDTLLSDWREIHDNGFLLEGLDEGRLKNNIVEE